MNPKNMKNTHPLQWVPTLYFAMGLPFVALSLVSVLVFKDMGVSDDRIAFWTTWLLLPWSLKPIFSLIMETFGNKKQYIVLTEIAAALMFGVIVFVLPLQGAFFWVLVSMGIIAISGSTHDIAGDGMYMQELDNATQSLYSGWLGAFYNIAKVLVNGGLVFLAGWLSTDYHFSKLEAWQVIMAICGVLMLSVALYHIIRLPTQIKENTVESFEVRKNRFQEILSSFFNKKYIWFYLGFIFLYRFAEGLAMKIAPLFLVADPAKGGIGLSKEEYGIVYGTFGTVAFIVGSIVSGHLVSKYGLKKSLFYLACAFNLPFVVYLLFAVFLPGSLVHISIGIIFEYFGYGFGFVGLVVFMMQQIAPGKYQMAHYAFANSLMNLGIMVPGMISGYFSEWLGYRGFFILVMVMTIPAILISKLVPFTYDDSKK